MGCHLLLNFRTRWNSHENLQLKLELSVIWLSETAVVVDLRQFYDMNSELKFFVTIYIRVFEYSYTKTKETDFDRDGYWMDRVNF